MMIDEDVPCTPPRVLIVEDEGVIAMRLERLLARLDYEVVGMASNGRQAIREAMKKQPDLILMDIKLSGGLDGIETATKIRAHLDTPIVYLSAHPEQMITDEVKCTRPSGFLSKPVRDQELLATIEMALYKHRMEAKLRESERRFRSVFEQASAGIAIVIPNDQIVDVNEKMCSILGYTREELLAQNIRDITYPEDLERESCYVQEVLAGKRDEFNIEKRFVHKEGYPVWADVSSNVVRDENGRIQFVIGVVVDITERKRVEEALRKNEALFKGLTDNSFDIMNILDADGAVVYESYATKRILGYDAGGRVGKSAFEYVHPDDLENVREQFKRLLETPSGQAIVEEFRFQRQDGSWCWVETSGQNFLDDPALHGILINSREITERKQMEDTLRESEDRFRLITESCSGVIFQIDLEGQVTYCSPSAESMLGFTSDEVMGLHLTRFFPEDRIAEAVHNFEQVIITKCVRTIEAEIIDRDGSPVSVEATLSPILKDGQVLGVQGHVRDIAERKQAEKALRDRERRLHLLHEIDAAILSAQSSEAIARAALERLHAIVPYYCASVSEIDLSRQRGRDIVFMTPEGDMGKQIQSFAWYPLSAAGDIVAAAQQGRVHLVQDTAALENPSPLEQSLISIGVRAYISAPMIVRDELVGVLNLAMDRPDSFQPAHVEILEEVAASLAVAIQQANLLAQTKQDAEMKTMLLHELNHRVMNNLTMILSLITLEMEQLRSMDDQTDLQAVLQDLYSRIQGIATVHEMLKAPLSDDLRDEVDLEALISQVLQAALSASPIQQWVDVVVDAAEDLPCISSGQATTLALVLNELATNCAKYAFEGRKQGRVHVQIDTVGGDDQNNQDNQDRYDEARKVRLIYRDDGPGLPDDVLAREGWASGGHPRQSIGLWLIQANVTRDLRGEIAWRNDGGLVVEIRFPV